MAKFSKLGFLLYFLAASAWADGGTAYLALKAAQQAADASANLISVTGERGEPQPQEWKLVFNDPAARGGVREVVASGDVVVSQRTPLKGYTGLGKQSSIALARLNLDSDRAFEIVNKQAVSKRIGFSWVDYTLRANETSGAPMWILKLYDSMGIRVGTVQVSAEDGSLIAPLEAGEPAAHGIRRAIQRFADRKESWGLSRQGGRHAWWSRQRREEYDASDCRVRSGISYRRKDNWPQRPR